MAVLPDGGDDSGVDLLSGLGHDPTVPSARRGRRRTGRGPGGMFGGVGGEELQPRPPRTRLPDDRPVTVSITRHLDPGREAEMVSWMQAGIALAERFPRFLGAGWVRPERDSETWHVLYRFADTEALAAWESSHQREWWRDSSSGLGVVESRVERRAGIEGWFDDPASREVRDLRRVAGPPPPPRWKQAVVIWLAFFPLSLAGGVAIRTVAPTWARSSASWPRRSR